MGNYRYVADANFEPFSMQEMLVPFQLYKDAYEKSEAAYNDLTTKADKYKYLSENLPEGSKARQIYEGYANSLNEQARDFAQNGLNMRNRAAIVSLRNRYQGEIGRLDRAQTALEEEIKMRRAMNAQDPSMIYTTDNLNIDSFLDDNKPNMYGVSGNKLYERGLQIGASDSSRIWSDTHVQNINDYYQSMYQTSGRDPRVLEAWRNDLASIPELNDSVEGTLQEFGVNDNLKNINPLGYVRAKEAVINGIINGSTYKRADSVQRNLGVLTRAEQVAKEESDRNYQLQKDQFNLNLAEAGWKRDGHGGFVPDDKAYYKSVGTSKSGKSRTSSGSNGKHNKLNKSIVIEYNDKTSSPKVYSGDIPSEENGKPIDYGNTYTYNELYDQIHNTEGKHSYFYKGKHKYKATISTWNSIASRIPAIVKEYPEDYTIFYKPYNEDDNTPARITIIPNKSDNDTQDNVGMSADESRTAAYGLVQ